MFKRIFCIWILSLLATSIFAYAQEIGTLLKDREIPFDIDKVINIVSEQSMSFNSNHNRDSRAGEFPINTDIIYGPAGHNQRYPSIAFNGTNYLVVWEDRRSPYCNIYGARVSASGEILDTAGIIIATGLDYRSAPAVASDGTNYLVVWHDSRGRSDPSDYDILGVLVSASGEILDTAGIGVSTAIDHQWYPSAAFDGTNYFVVWEDLRGGSQMDIYGARVNQSGVVLDTLGIDISPASGGQYYPDVGFNGTNYLVVWYNQRGVTGYDIEGARVSPSGEVLDPWPSAIIISDAPEGQYAPSVTSDSMNYFVVWFDARDNPFDIYGARVSAAGVVLDTAGIAISTAMGEKRFSAVAFDGINYLVTWQDARDNPFDIYGARVNTAGVVLDTTSIAIAVLPDSQSYASVAFGSTTYLVVWEDKRNSSDFDWDVFGARVNQSGIVLDPSSIAISTAANSQEYASVAFDGTNYLIVWEDKRAGVYYDIYGARVNQSGTVLDLSGIVISNAVNNQNYPTVAFDGTNYLVAWADYRSWSWDIYGARVNQSGIVLDPSGIVISNAAYTQNYPSIAFNDTYYFIAWQDERNGSDLDIYGARVNQSGIVLDPSGISVSTAVNDQENPAVASDSTNYFVLWQDKRSGSDRDIYGSRVNQSGFTLDPSGIAISTGVEHQISPSIAFDGVNYLAVWQDERSDSSYDIYGTRVHQSGQVLDPAGIAISTAVGNQEDPAVAFDGTNYLVAWQDARDGYYDIYCAIVELSSAVIDSFIVSYQPGNQCLPTISRGQDDQMLVAYSGFLDSINGHPANTMRIWGWGEFYQPDTIPPTTPVLIVPSDNSYIADTMITFIWYHSEDTESGLQHYVLQYANNSSFVNADSMIVVDTFYTYNLQDTTYYWHVKAVDNAENQSNWSATWQFVVDTQSPVAPTLIVPIGGVTLKDTSVYFQWTDITKENKIRRKATLFGSPIRYVIQIDTSFSFTLPLYIDTLATSSTTVNLFDDFYYWKVKAYDLAGNQGLYSNPDSFEVDTSASMIESTTVWNDTSFAGPFEILTKVNDIPVEIDSVLLNYRISNAPDWEGSLMHSTGEPCWYVDTIPEVTGTDDTVRYYIRAVDIVGSWSTDPPGAPAIHYWFLANFTEIGELTQIPAHFSFGLKSNPAKGSAIFTVVMPWSGSIKLNIYDCTGRIIGSPLITYKPAGTYDIMWPLQLSAGIYFYSLESPWQKKIGKFVIVR